MAIACFLQLGCCGGEVIDPVTEVVYRSVRWCSPDGVGYFLYEFQVRGLHGEYDFQQGLIFTGLGGYPERDLDWSGPVIASDGAVSCGRLSDIRDDQSKVVEIDRSNW